MKIAIFVFINLLIINQLSFSQSVSLDPKNSITIVDIKSTNQGLKTPQLTCSQVLNLTNVTEGVLVYNLSSHLFNYYNGTAWKNIDGSSISSATNVGNPPTGMTSSVSGTSVTLNWGAVLGASAYSIQYRTVGSLIWTSTSSSTNSIIVNSLIAGYDYEWQVQAITPCGTSSFTSSINFTVPAAFANINVDYTFSPQAVTIGIGGQITWQGNFSSHPIRSGTPSNPTNLFQVNVGTSYTHTFNQAGIYSYFCQLHNTIGTITVQ